MAEMNASDDIDLLTAYAEKGDDAAFRQLVDKYAGMIYATAKRRTGDIEAAKEISQTTFAILARKAGSLKAHTSIGAWLHRTCVLESAKHLRSEYRHLRKMKALTDRERQVNEEHLWDRLEPCLDEAIERLPASDRQLIILRFIDGLKFREVGEKIGKTEEACRKQMGRALDRLSKVLSSQGTVISAAAIATGLRPLGFEPGAKGSVECCHVLRRAYFEAKTSPNLVPRVIRWCNVRAHFVHILECLSDNSELRDFVIPLGVPSNSRRLHGESYRSSSPTMLRRMQQPQVSP